MPKGLPAIAEQLQQLLTALAQHHSKIYLGGFSQGAIVSCHLTLNWPELIHKLFMLSGTLINAPQWQLALSHHHVRAIPSFQSHGQDDMVLPLAGARALNELFRAKPNHQFLEFSGGHEVPPALLQALGKFLSS